MRFHCSFVDFVTMTRRRAAPNAHSGLFKKGCVPHNKGPNRPANQYITGDVKPVYVRLDQDVQEMVDSTDYATTSHDAPIVDQPTRMLLRPRTGKKTALEAAQTRLAPDAELDTYRLLHARKTAELFNEAMSAHREAHPQCKGKLTFHQPGEIQRGLCWRMQLSCDSCEYVSPRRNLYTEVETGRRGPKAASANIGAQVALSHTGMSNTGLSRLLLGTNTPAPSRSYMQATTNKVSKIIQETNEKDMADICENLKIVQDERGQTGINIETDARYSNLVHSGVGKTPYQAAT